MKQSCTLAIYQQIYKRVYIHIYFDLQITILLMKFYHSNPPSNTETIDPGANTSKNKLSIQIVRIFIDRTSGYASRGT